LSLVFLVFEHPSPIAAHLFSVFLIRRFFICGLIGLFAGAGVAQNVQPGFDLSNYGVRIEPDKRLILVLVTLEMAQSPDAGPQKLLNTPLSPKGEEFRKQLLQDNAALNDDLRRRISNFVFQYKKRHPNASDAEIVSPFISMAYALSPVPDLADPDRSSDLPAQLLDVLDFAPLVREFYRRSTVNAKLDDYVMIYRAESEGLLRSSSREMVTDLLGYLHTRPQLYYIEKVKTQATKTKGKATLEKVETRTHERRFHIVPEMLSPDGNVVFLNAGDDYYAILPPDKDLRFSEVRRAYLQFVVDPLALGAVKEMVMLRPWTRSRLDERRKAAGSLSSDVVLAVSRSLAAAIDIRQSQRSKADIATEQARRKLAGLSSDEEKRAVTTELERFKISLADESAIQLAEDYDKGLVLVFFFADKLRDVEDSGFDIAASLKDMIGSFDEAKESARVTDGLAASQKALAVRGSRRENAAGAGVVADNPVTSRLLDIQKAIDVKDYARASAELTALSKKYPKEPRVFYNLGRVAGLIASGTNDPEEQAHHLVEAKEAYANVIDSATADTDRALLSLTYVALARIYEHFDSNDVAIKLYDGAIKVGDVGGGAYHEAIAGKQRLLLPRSQ
jgi:hypothetical protein